MNEKRLFNWEIEKKVKELESQLQFKEIKREDLEQFLLENEYYNGEADDVFILLSNINHARGRFDKADEHFKRLFDKWKVVSNKFPQNIQKLRYLADLIISKIEFIPDIMIKYFQSQNESDLHGIVEYSIDRYASYEKTYLLGEFLEKLPYESANPDTLFKLINASVELDPEDVDGYLNRALDSMKDPIAFLNNIKFSSELFGSIKPETLQKILDLPGIQTKFHQFIKFESFMESLDNIPSLDAIFFINISNQLYTKNLNLSIQYGMRAIRKQDFTVKEHLSQLLSACEKDPPDQPSVAEILLLTSLKEGKYEKIWTIVDNSYFINAKTVAQFDTALKYTAAAVKISQAKSEMISKHILFLSKRIRSVDGPEGILEGDRYKHKEENQAYNQQIEAYRALYLKRTGKKFLI
ncbi:MAG: hypothetical protein GY863_00315 [bacterium]|nr:hypothetical protein [bacterium]